MNDCMTEGVTDKASLGTVCIDKVVAAPAGQWPGHSCGRFRRQGAIAAPQCHITLMDETENYRVVLQKDGTYGVEFGEPGGPAPTLVTGFRTETEAEMWIVKERQMTKGHH
jgi:hypothetical protein